jgi:tetraacyldisaccharide 4'-kinase
MLPAGDLREFRVGIKRADLLIVTKCPFDLDAEEKKYFMKNAHIESNKIFFSSIQYGLPISFSKEVFDVSADILLITGIANPMPLEEYVRTKNSIETIFFPDHHDFSVVDIRKIHAKFDIMPSRKKLILTTEKDYMRLKDTLTEMEMMKYSWFYLPIEVKIDREEDFINEITGYVRAI